MAEQKKPKVGFELEKEEATYSHHGIILTIFFFLKSVILIQTETGTILFPTVFFFLTSELPNDN